MGRNADPMDATLESAIVTTRTFDATPAQVFAAWTRPDLLSRWWGPNGFTTTTHAFDFRVGGGWKHTMHGPDGTDYPNRLAYVEISPGARIVYDHFGGIDGVPAQFRMTATFEAEGSGTRLTMRHQFRTRDERDAVVAKYKADEGARETLARLGGAVAEPPALPELRMSRTFRAPVRLVWAAWSTGENVARWFAPAPLTVPACVVELRPGGAFRLTMRTPDGQEFPMDGQFVEVEHERKLVFEADAHAFRVRTTVLFREHDGKTTLDVHQSYSNDAPHIAGAWAGWTATLDQLGAVAQAG